MVLVALVVGCSDGTEQGAAWTMTSSPTVTSGDASGDASSGSDDPSDSTEAPSSSSPATTDPDDTGDESSTGVDDCTIPAPDPAWLPEHLQDVVASLSGELPIDGVLLTDRASTQRRALVAAWLLEQLGVLGIDAEAHDYGTGTNVVATIPATGPSQGTLVLGAHYDTVPGSPGANDNATGVAMVTAAARYLATVPCRTHDVLLVAFDEEEIGLVGSAAFAAKLVDDGTPVVSVHTIDQMGWDADGDRVIELERPDDGLVEFYDDVLAEVPTVGGLTVTDTGATDHVSFRAVGFAAVGITEEYVSGDTTPHYHLPSDVYDTVDFGLLASTTTLLHRAFAAAITGG